MKMSKKIKIFFDECVERELQLSYIIQAKKENIESVNNLHKKHVEYYEGLRVSNRFSIESLLIMYKQYEGFNDIVIEHKGIQVEYRKYY